MFLMFLMFLMFARSDVHGRVTSFCFLSELCVWRLVVNKLPYLFGFPTNIKINSESLEKFWFWVTSDKQWRAVMVLGWCHSFVNCSADKALWLAEGNCGSSDVLAGVTLSRGQRSQRGRRLLPPLISWPALVWYWPNISWNTNKPMRPQIRAEGSGTRQAVSSELQSDWIESTKNGQNELQIIINCCHGDGLTDGDDQSEDTLVWIVTKWFCVAASSWSLFINTCKPKHLHTCEMKRDLVHTKLWQSACSVLTRQGKSGPDWYQLHVTRTLTGNHPNETWMFVSGCVRR